MYEFEWNPVERMNAGTHNLIDWMNVGKFEEYDEIEMTKKEGIRSNDYVNVCALSLLFSTSTFIIIRIKFLFLTINNFLIWQIAKLDSCSPQCETTLNRKTIQQTMDKCHTSIVLRTQVTLSKSPQVVTNTISRAISTFMICCTIAYK